MRTSSTSRACCASATRASSRSRRPPARSRKTWRSSKNWPPRRGGRCCHSGRGEPQGPQNPSPHPAMDGADARQGSADLRPGRNPSHAGFAFTLEHWNLYDSQPLLARDDHRDQGREAAQDAQPAICAQRAKSQQAESQAGRSFRPESAADPVADRPMGQRTAGTGKVCRQVRRPNRRGRGQASGRRDARPGDRHRSQGRVPRPQQGSTPSTPPR